MISLMLPRYNVNIGNLYARRVGMLHPCLVRCFIHYDIIKEVQTIMRTVAYKKIIIAELKPLTVFYNFGV